MLVNLTLWNNIESLHNYVYRSGHVEIMKRRNEWFEMMQEFYMVLWWVPLWTKPNKSWLNCATGDPGAMPLRSSNLSQRLARGNHH